METLVYNQQDAIDWLKKEAKNLIDDFSDSSYDASDVSDIIEDLLGNVETIEKNDWQWVGIEECAMAVSNINVFELKRG